METWILSQNQHTGNYELIPKSLRNTHLNYTDDIYGIIDGKWYTIYSQVVDDKQIEYYTCETSPYTLIKLLDSMPNNKKLIIVLDPLDHALETEYIQQYYYHTITRLVIKSSPEINWCKLFPDLEKLEAYNTNIFPHNKLKILVLACDIEDIDFSDYPSITEIYTKKYIFDLATGRYVKSKQPLSLVKSACKR
jgi:hypothetical protein